MGEAGVAMSPRAIRDGDADLTREVSAAVDAARSAYRAGYERGWSEALESSAVAEARDEASHFAARVRELEREVADLRSLVSAAEGRFAA